MTTYRIVTNLGAGGAVRLFYQPAGHPRPNRPSMEFQLPFLRCTVEEYNELGRQCGGPLIEHTFVLVQRETGVGIEWVT